MLRYVCPQMAAAAAPTSVSKEPRARSPAPRRSAAKDAKDRSRSPSPERDENGNTEQENLQGWLELNLYATSLHPTREPAKSFYWGMRMHTFDRLVWLASSESQKKYPRRLKSHLERNMLVMSAEQKKKLGFAVDEMERLALEYG